MLRRVLALLVASLQIHSHAEEEAGPYEVFPPAEPPYFRIRYEGGKEPGELAFAVKYTLWLPPGVKNLRGLIVHQHGCGVGSCKSGLTGAYDLHWQALAMKHQCALMAPSYEQPQDANCQLWCDPRNGSDARFRQSLNDLAKTSGHPELANVPWALWGHSGGGHWAGGMLMLHPERIAAVWLRSGVPFLKPDPKRPSISPHRFPQAALQVPVMCNLGTKEGYSEKNGRFSGVWPANKIFFNEVASKGGQIGYAIDPLTSHECGNQRYFAIRWFDACLGLRLPESPGAPMPLISSKNPESLRHQTEGRSIWLPSTEMKKVWKAYVKNTKIPDTTPPPPPTNLKVNGNILTWEATADLESGLAHFIVFKNGKPIGTVPENPVKRFGRPLFQGLQYSDTPQQPLARMTFTDPNPPLVSKPHYRVIAVNTVGLKSK